MSYLTEQKWDADQARTLKENAKIRDEVRARVRAGLPRW
jgi:hypothetical protein